MPAKRPKVRYATIYVFPAGAKGVRVSAAPERLTVKPGDVVDWTIVNATSGAAGEVSIAWKGRSPMTEEPKPFERFQRAEVRKVKSGLYRYSILINGKEVFDPELEVMN